MTYLISKGGGLDIKWNGPKSVRYDKSSCQQNAFTNFDKCLCYVYNIFTVVILLLLNYTIITSDQLKSRSVLFLSFSSFLSFLGFNLFFNVFLSLFLFIIGLFLLVLNSLLPLFFAFRLQLLSLFNSLL